jgi:hypothetical protein
MARLGRARLTLACLPERPPLLAYLAPLAFGAPPRPLETEADELLRRAAAMMPGDIPVLKLLLSGGWPELAQELERGGYDLIVAEQSLRWEKIFTPSARRLLGRPQIDTPVLRVRA